MFHIMQKFLEIKKKEEESWAVRLLQANAPAHGCCD